MPEAESKVPVKAEKKTAKSPSALAAYRPVERLRREIDRLFEEFDRGFWSPSFGPPMFAIEPFWRREVGSGAAPAVDIAENDTAYEVTAELPGLDEKAIEVKIADGGLIIKGEKREEKEEKKRDYYLHERRFGAFERCFAVPDGVDTDKIEASFKKGVLTVTLPKKADAQKPAKKIEVKTA